MEAKNPGAENSNNPVGLTLGRWELEPWRSSTGPRDSQPTLSSSVSPRNVKPCHEGGTLAGSQTQYVMTDEKTLSQHLKKCF